MLDQLLPTHCCERSDPSTLTESEYLHYHHIFNSSIVPEGFVYIERKVLNEKSIPDFANSKKPIASVTLSDKYIEHHLEYALHADFANKHIGGGVLRGGLVQEEILFVIKPECLISRLLCETMNPNEVIIIAGAEQFSLYKGYGRTVTFAGNFIDETPRFATLHLLSTEG